ncbi:Cytochrome P450 [Apodemus speciosus]|uniref:Cytochrome P450 n=1 Tax=Apodemus speciosus TaxID=105296 RepID=A0ABQ0FK83_APOSI
MLVCWSINLSTMLDKAVCNVIASLIFAHHFEYEDPHLIRMLKVLEERLREAHGFIPEVLNTFLILLRPPGLADKVFQDQKTFRAILNNILTENRKILDAAQPPRNLTDAFLAEIEMIGSSTKCSKGLWAETKGNPESSFNDEKLHVVVDDLFTAGILSTSTTLSWALLIMILHPDVQREPDWS